MRRYTEARHFFEHGAEHPAKQSLRPLSFRLQFLRRKPVMSQRWRKQLDVVAQQGPEAERSVAFPLLVLQLDAAGSSRSRKGSRTDSGRRHRQQLR